MSELSVAQPLAAMFSLNRLYHKTHMHTHFEHFSTRLQIRMNIFYLYYQPTHETTTCFFSKTSPEYRICSIKLPSLPTNLSTEKIPKWTRRTLVIISLLLYLLLVDWPTCRRYAVRHLRGNTREFVYWPYWQWDIKKLNSHETSLNTEFLVFFSNKLSMKSKL